MPVLLYLEYLNLNMSIISITGTPGTGKTKIAKLLAEKLGYNLIDLNKLAEEKNLYNGYDEKRGCKIVDIDRTAREIDKMGDNLVLESHYAHDMPADFVVILRTKPKELRDRLRNKGWRKEKVEENVLAEIMEIIKTEALESGKRVLEVDTTGKKPEQAVQDIIKSLNLKQ